MGGVAEAAYVRQHFDEVNAQLSHEGLRMLDPSDSRIKAHRLVINCRRNRGLHSSSFAAVRRLAGDGIAPTRT
jgi:hypothetical protein